MPWEAAKPLLRLLTRPALEADSSVSSFYIGLSRWTPRNSNARQDFGLLISLEVAMSSSARALNLIVSYCLEFRVREFVYDERDAKKMTHAIPEVASP